MEIKAKANANIALVKYWGKRDEKLNLPAVGSISVTLDQLTTITTVETDESLTEDEIIINGKTPTDKEILRISSFLGKIRSIAHRDEKVRVSSRNNFPTGAGLASSASGFAALALAGTKAYGLDPDPQELSILARKGSGSAARSVFGGFVEMIRGYSEDGIDDFAMQIADENYWDLKALILITSEEKKKVSSTTGMIHTSFTSPYFQAWVDSSDEDIQEAKFAIYEKDFEKLAEISELSCLKMHALALSAKPGLIYWNGSTIDLINEVRRGRANGIPMFFTVDAGPQVKVFTTAAYVEKVKGLFEGHPGITKILTAGIGSDAKILRDED